MNAIWFSSAYLAILLAHHQVGESTFSYAVDKNNKLLQYRWSKAASLLALTNIVEYVWFGRLYAIFQFLDPFQGIILKHPPDQVCSWIIGGGGNRTCQFNANRCFELLAFASQNVQLPHGPGSDAFHL